MDFKANSFPLNTTNYMALGSNRSMNHNMINIWKNQIEGYFKKN